MKNLCYKDSQIGYLYLASVDDEENNGIVHSFKDAWAIEDVLEEVSDATETKFEYKMLGAKPVITVVPSAHCIDITNYVPIIENTPNIDDANLGVLAKQLAQMTNSSFEIEDARVFVETVRMFLARQRTSDNAMYLCVNPNFPAEEAVKTIVSANEGSAHKVYSVVTENKTLYMNNPGAEVFIKVPNYAELMHYYREGYVQLPSKSSFMPDYKNPELATGKYKQYCAGDPKLLKEVQGNPDNNVNSNAGNYGVDETNLLDENGIFPNELNYYKSICNMLDAAVEAREVVKQQRIEKYGASAPRNEHQYEKLEPVSKEDEFCRAVRYYMIWLMERAAQFNWTHTGNVVIYREGSIDEEDDDDFSDSSSESSSSDTVDSSQLFYTIDNASKFNGVDSQEVTALVYDRFIDEDPHSIAEFLLKSLRWGDRKPTKVVFSSSKINSEFDFKEYSLTRKSFSYANSKKVIKDGVEYYLVGEIKTTSILKCTAYKSMIGDMLMNVPIGIATQRFFESPSGEVRSQWVYMSVIDVLEILKDSPKAINGIQLNQDGTYSVDKTLIKNDLTIDKAVNSARDSAAADVRHKVYESERVIKLAIQFGITDVSSLAYLNLISSLLQNARLNMILDGYNFKTLSEGKALCRKSDVTSVVTGKLGNEIILKVAKILNAAHANSGLTLEESLNCAKSLFDVSSDFIEEKGTAGTASAMAALTQRMNLVGSEGEEDMNVKEVMNSVIIDDINKAKDFCLITYNGNPEFSYGRYTDSNGRNILILSDDVRLAGGATDRKDFSEVALTIAATLIALPMMEEANYSKIKYKFADSNSHKKFYKCFNAFIGQFGK